MSVSVDGMFSIDDLSLADLIFVFKTKRHAEITAKILFFTCDHNAWWLPADEIAWKLLCWAATVRIMLKFLKKMQRTVCWTRDAIVSDRICSVISIYFRWKLRNQQCCLEFVTRAVMRFRFTLFGSLHFSSISPKGPVDSEIFRCHLSSLTNVWIKCFPESAESLPNKEPRTSRHLNRWVQFADGNSIFCEHCN